MKTRQRNIGEEQVLYPNGQPVKAVITNIKSVDKGRTKGTLEEYSIDDYGVTQEFFYKDGISPELTEQRYSRSMIPPEYFSKRAKDFNWTRYHENTDVQKDIGNSFITRFSEYRKQGRGLYISSHTKGSGKTFLACCMANEIIVRYGISVKFITVPDYIELVKEKSDQAREDILRIKDCALLVLDDIGAEGDSKDWITTAVFRLVDFRDKHILPTIYTSNYEMENLPGDERTADRIVGHSVPLVMPEYSVRRSEAKRKTEDFLKGLLKEPAANGQALPNIW